MARGYFRKHRFTVNFPDGHRKNASSPKQVIKLVTDDCTISTEIGEVSLEQFRQEYQDELTEA